MLTSNSYYKNVAALVLNILALKQYRFGAFFCAALGERWGDVCQKNKNNVKFAEKNKKYNNKNKVQSCRGGQMCYNGLKLFSRVGVLWI
ncbi:hypothetical protein [Phascolarctobacterium succinatutens]|uniref:hypothetical protein n=1 Tax=Phascolarctobacterium succinatutens TaxID=626940 RepID=UPI00307A8FAC